MKKNQTQPRTIGLLAILFLLLPLFSFKEITVISSFSDELTAFMQYDCKQDETTKHGRVISWSVAGFQKEDTALKRLIKEINLLKCNLPGYVVIVVADDEGVVISTTTKYGADYVVPVKWADVKDFSLSDGSFAFVTDFKVVDYHSQGNYAPFFEFRGKKYGQFSKNSKKEKNEKFAFVSGDKDYLKNLYKLVYKIWHIKNDDDDDDLDF